MKRCPVARSHPQAATFPSRVRVVNSAINLLRKKSHWVWNPQFDDTSVHKRVERIRLVAGCYWRVGPKTQRVVLVNPKIIRVLRGAENGVSGEARAADKTTTPPDISRPFRRLVRSAAPCICGDRNSQCNKIQRHPNDAVAIDVHAADAVARQRHFVNFGESGIGRI